MQWVEGLNSQCSVLIENEEQFESAKSEHDVLFIGYFESLDSIEFDLFDDICKQYRWEKDIWAYEPRFAVILEPELRAKLSGRTPGMTVYCAFKGILCDFGERNVSEFVFHKSMKILPCL